MKRIRIIKVTTTLGMRVLLALFLAVQATNAETFLTGARDAVLSTLAITGLGLGVQGLLDDQRLTPNEATQLVEAFINEGGKCEGFGGFLEKKGLDSFIAIMNGESGDYSDWDALKGDLNSGKTWFQAKKTVVLPMAVGMIGVGGALCYAQREALKAGAKAMGTLSAQILGHAGRVPNITEKVLAGTVVGIGTLFGAYLSGIPQWFSRRFWAHCSATCATAKDLLFGRKSMEQN